VAPSVDELWRSGDLRAAADASAAALELYGEPFRGTDTADLELARLLHDHGTLCWYVARFDEAERCLDRAYDIRQTLLGDTHLETLDTLGRLAGLANYQRRIELADDRYDRLVEVLRGIEGNKGMRLAIARRNYAAFLRDGDQKREARELMDQATKVLKHTDQPLELLALRKADALLHCVQRDHRRALDLVEAALRDAPLPADHPHLATARLIAARTLLILDSFAEGLRLVDELVPQLERGYGDHPIVAIAIQLRAQLTIEAGRPHDAIADQTRAVAIAERFYPDRWHTPSWKAQLKALRRER
jgi:hypothetical protein